MCKKDNMLDKTTLLGGKRYTLIPLLRVVPSTSSVGIATSPSPGGPSKPQVSGNWGLALPQLNFNPPTRGDPPISARRHMCVEHS